MIWLQLALNADFEVRGGLANNIPGLAGSLTLA